MEKLVSSHRVFRSQEKILAAWPISSQVNNKKAESVEKLRVDSLPTQG